MRILLFAFFAYTSFGAHAQSISALDLAKLCSGSDNSERLTCNLIFKTYMDGFVEGVGKGVHDTYQYDEKVFAIIKNEKISDISKRIKNVSDQSICIQKISVAEMANTFVEYLLKNPEMQNSNYKKVITKSIIATYCRK